MPRRPPPSSIASRAAPRLPSSAGLEVHAGHGLDFVTAETIAALPRNRRTQYRPFSDRRGDLRRPAAAVRTMRAAMDRGTAKCEAIAMILGIGSDITDVRRIAKVIERHGDRFIDRVFTATERAAPKGGATGSRPTPSASPPRRPAPRRWEPGCAPASGGATWAWSTCRRGRPTMELTGGAKRRLAGDHAGGLRGAHRPHDHRRRADGARFRHHLGGRHRYRRALIARRIVRDEKFVMLWASAVSAWDCWVNRRGRRTAAKSPRNCLWVPQRLQDRGRARGHETTGR